MLIAIAGICTCCIFGLGFIAGRLDRDVSRIKPAVDIMKMLDPGQVSAMRDRGML